MLTSLRAALAAALLAGFYLFAVGIVGGLSWAAIVLAQSGRFNLKLFLIAGLAAIGLIVAIWKVVRTRPEMPSGVIVDRAEAPQLWDEVTNLAERVGTRAPDEIQLVAEVNAAVVEDAKWLGLVAGRRYLLIGTPLIQTFTVDQLRSVLAHELGHYSHSHTRLGALTYRGRLSIAHVCGHVDGFVGWMMRGYARIFMLVESAVSRRQEHEADLASVQVAGVEAAASALLELAPLGQAWHFYLQRYVASGLDSGYAPNDVLTGFPAMWQARADEIDELRSNPEPEKGSWWDSHPPTADRVALIRRQSDVDAPRDVRPAAALIADLPSLLTRVEQQEFNFGERRRVSMLEFTANAQQASVQPAADRLITVAGRLARSTQPGLRTIVDLIHSGRHDELVAAVGPSEYPELVRAAVAATAVSNGVAVWRHSWSGPVELIGSGGVPLPVEELAEPLINGDRDGSSKALIRMLELGVQ